MLETFASKLDKELGGDLYPGLMGLFFFLHFYYGVPAQGWQRAGIGVAATVFCTFVLSLISFKLGNGFRSAIALIAAALALDFFYRGQLGKGAEHLVFEYLWNGPASINFASFALASTWLFAQMDSRPISTPPTSHSR